MTSFIMRAPFATVTADRIRITPDRTVGELTERYPDTVRLFSVCGIDSVASAPLALEDIALLHHLDLSELLRAVARAAERV